MATAVSNFKTPDVRIEGASRVFLIAYSGGGWGFWGSLEDWQKLNTEETQRSAVAIFTIDTACEPEEFDIQKVGYGG